MIVTGLILPVLVIVVGQLIDHYVPSLGTLPLRQIPPLQRITEHVSLASEPQNPRSALRSRRPCF
jgi:hypothetical protein